MNIHICTDKQAWDSWFFSQKQHEFLQSWDWGAFQQTVGKEALRVQIFDTDGNIHTQAQGLVHRLPLGISYVSFQRIPQMDREAFGALADFLRNRSMAFMHLEPTGSIPALSELTVQARHRQPGQTLLLDLSVSEDELLSAMHAKTRYNIRLAGRKGVRVEEKKDSDLFWRLNEETSARDAFKTHDRAYYARMLDQPEVIQLNAYHEDEPIASNICVRFGDRFTYLHGASANSHRNLMAPYLLQWHGMRRAKALGCSEYDFWGIAPPIAEESQAKKTCFHELCWDVNHPWTGITRFKAGFGGRAVIYPQAIDVALRSWQYRLYRLAKRRK